MRLTQDFKGEETINYSAVSFPSSADFFFLSSLCCLLAVCCASVQLEEKLCKLAVSKVALEPRMEEEEVSRRTSGIPVFQCLPLVVGVVAWSISSSSSSSSTSASYWTRFDGNCGRRASHRSAEKHLQIATVVCRNFQKRRFYRHGNAATVSASVGWKE